MKLNSEITHADVNFSLHFFILREKDIYGSQVYPLLLFPAKPWIEILQTVS